jgi:hypothetical protein
MSRAGGGVLYLMGRWLRGRAVRRSSVVLGVAFAVLAAVFVCVSSFALSPMQQADSQLGAYGQSTYDSVEVGTIGARFIARTGAALTSVAPGSHLLISTPEMRPDSFTKLWVQGPVSTVQFVEDPGLRQAFPGRYTLNEGSWPVSPSEVVVSRHLLDALPDRTGFTMLSGRVRLRVVGVVTDSYDRHGDTIVAGAGTWESIPPGAPGRTYQPVGAQVRALFGADTPAVTVTQVLQRLLPPRPADQGTRAEVLQSNLSSRSQVISSAAATAFGNSGDLVVSYLPLLLVVLVVSALVIGQTRGPYRASADRLVAIGVRRRRVVASQVLSLLVAATGSIAAGLALGWLLGLVLRLAVLPRFANQPLSPVPGLNGTALGIAALSLGLIAAGTVWPERGDAAVTRSLAARWRTEVPDGLVRRVCAVLLVVVAVRIGDTRVAVYIAMAAVLLVGPDLLRIVLRLLPDRDPHCHVAVRLMRSELGRQAAAVVVVASCLALPICVATQLASTKLSQSALTYNLIPDHQIWIQRNGDTGDVAGVARVVARVPEAGRPVAVRGLALPPGPTGQVQSEARFDNLASGGTATMVLESADQLARLLGGKAMGDPKGVLDAGGVVDFTGDGGKRRFVVYGPGGDPQRTTSELPTSHTGVPRQFTVKYSGAILLATARKLGLPVSQPDAFFFPAVGDATIRAAVAAAVDAGYDSEFVQYAVPPPPPQLPAAAYVFLAGLVLGGFTVMLSVIRGQARRLRTYSSRLIALGVGPRWTLSVLGIQAAITVLVGATTGVAAGILGVTITANSYTVLDVPTLPIVLACAATAAAAALATALAVRALTATEHVQLN